MPPAGRMCGRITAAPLSAIAASTGRCSTRASFFGRELSSATEDYAATLPAVDLWTGILATPTVDARESQCFCDSHKSIEKQLAKNAVATMRRS